MDKFGFEPSNNIRKLITMGVAHQSDAVAHLDDPTLGDNPNLRVVLDIGGAYMRVAYVEVLDEDPLEAPRQSHLRKMRGEPEPEGEEAEADKDEDGEETDGYGN